MRERYDSKNYSRQSTEPPDARKKNPPPGETNAEIFYYKKQIDSRTLMVIVLRDGEEIEGTIEWYDRDALKVNRTDKPNVLLLKHNIKYMFKAEDRSEKVKSEK
jgi:sRNA-binding regulator protein Hfq